MQKFAFVVGIGMYRNSFPELPAARDAYLMQALLMGADDRVTIDAAWDVTTVVAGASAQTSVDLAKEYLKWRFRVEEAFGAGDETHVLVYYAGHAAADRAHRDPASTARTIRLQASDGPWMSVDDLFSSVVALGAHNTTFIMDCCHAGALTQEFRRAALRGEQTAGVAVLAACANLEKAKSAGLSGEFTSVVLNGLGRDRAVSPGPVRASDLAQYVVDHWNDLSPGITSDQTPDVLVELVPQAVPLITIIRQAHGSETPATTPTETEAETIVSPHEDVQAEQVGTQLRVAWIIRPTKELRPWPVPVGLRPSERLLAVTSLSDRTGAFFLVSGTEGTRVIRATPGQAASSFVIPEGAACTGGRFGIGRDLGTVALTSPDGTEKRYSLFDLSMESSNASGS